MEGNQSKHGMVVSFANVRCGRHKPKTLGECGCGIYWADEEFLREESDKHFREVGRKLAEEHNKQFAEMAEVAAEGIAEICKIVADATWPRPIPVSERLPEKGDVLIYVTDPEDGISGWQSGWLNSKGTFEHLWEPRCIVTHWLPLPPKPE